MLGFDKGGILAVVAPAVYGAWQRENGWCNYSFAFTNLRYNSNDAFIVTQTGTFDYFKFEDVEVGGTHFINVYSHRYTFAQPAINRNSAERNQRS